MFAPPNEKYGVSSIVQRLEPASRLGVEISIGKYVEFVVIGHERGYPSSRGFRDLGTRYPLPRTYCVSDGPFSPSLISRFPWHSVAGS
jgi:hypothetical protein